MPRLKPKKRPGPRGKPKSALKWPAEWLCQICLAQADRYSSEGVPGVICWDHAEMWEESHEKKLAFRAFERFADRVPVKRRGRRKP